MYTACCTVAVVSPFRESSFELVSQLLLVGLILMVYKYVLSSLVSSSCCIARNRPLLAKEREGVTSEGILYEALVR